MKAVEQMTFRREDDRVVKGCFLDATGMVGDFAHGQAAIVLRLSMPPDAIQIVELIQAYPFDW